MEQVLVKQGYIESKRTAILGGLINRGLGCRELVCPLICSMLPTVIWAMWIPFFHFYIWKVFSLHNRRLTSWMELEILQTLMEAMLAFAI